MKRPIVIKGNIALVSLTKGYTAIIDAEDVKTVDVGNWTAIEAFGSAYAYRKSSKASGSKTIYMHRLIVDAGINQHVDHIDGNRLNNRKCNLRTCTPKQNQYNQGIRKSNTSGYKGVSWSKANCKWAARIRYKGKKVHLGYYDKVEDAADAYFMASKSIHKEFSVFSRDQSPR